MLGILRTLVVIAVMLPAMMLSGQSKGGVKTPDFAYPKTVSEQAQKSLSVALQADDTKGILRGLLDYTLAQTTIGRENLPACMAKIDSVKSHAGDNAVLRGMLNTLEAVLYNNMYTSARWKYDRRAVITLLPLPADCNEWSGQQFRYKIESLLDVALSDSVALRTVPLTAYKDVIQQNRITSIYYPTLYSFVVNNAIDIMRQWSDLGDDRKLVALYESVIADEPRNSAAGVNARLGREQLRIVNEMRSGFDYDRSSAFWKLYESYLASDGRPVTEYAGDILLEINTTKTDSKELYGAIKKFMKAYPAYWRSDCMLQRINQLEQKQVSLSAPMVTGPGREIQINLDMTNVSRLNVDIYDVSSTAGVREDFVFTQGMTGVRKIASLPVEAGGESVPFEVKRQVSYTFERPGNYIAVPVVAGKTIKNEGIQKIHVTSVALGATYFLDRTIWAVDANTGEPLSDVELGINTAPYKQGSVTKSIGVTDAEGALVVTEGNGMITAARGADRYAMPLYVHTYDNTRPDKWVMDAGGYTSLPLYHPGDTVAWTAICYEYKGGLNRPYAGKDVSAVLYDANSMPVDTLHCVTDRFGRVWGEFLLPTEGLTGAYRIDIDKQHGTVVFEVSDYKLPTFKVSAPKVEQNAPSSGDVTLRGKVETYAGFPVADAEVALSLSVTQRPRWWYPSRSYDLYTSKVRTGADGSYEIVVESEVFAASPMPNGYYTADISVLSTVGETQTGRVSFSLGERYIIKATVPSAFDISKVSMPIVADVVNFEDSIVSGAVDFRLETGDSTVVTASKISGNGIVNVSGIAQGIYKAVFAREHADTVTCEVILYDASSTSSPCPDRLVWSPSQSVTVDGDTGIASWLYAVNCDTHLLATVWTSDSIISRRWVKSAQGFNKFTVALPAGVDKATLSLFATGNYRQECYNVDVERADSGKGLRIVAETFRDRTVPGQDEVWTFRVTGPDGNGREAAVIADMYNTALDALAKSDWRFSPRTGMQPWFRYALSGLSATADYYTSIQVKPLRKLNCQSLTSPVFNTYGRSFTSYLNGGVMMRALATNMSAKMMSTSDDVVVEEAMADAGYGMNAVPMLTGGVERSEAMTEDEAEAEWTAQADKVAAFAYRDSNVPLAFFRPALVTDKDGHLELRFTVPNANTTWGFRALAFTDSLLSATFSRDVVASKEIMVQPNLPRFLRTGDKTVVNASVMNNTEDVRYVATDVEIFNPSDGENILTMHRNDTIAPRGNAVVAIEFAVPSEQPFIGYRIKSSALTHADGEQAVIPVLPSVTPVIETVPFYLGASQHEFSMRMPEMPKDGHVSLQLCENPVWYVVTALPGLLKNESATAPDAARAIFSASVAAGLLRDNPAIADALRAWSENGRSAEMLTSMLQRNEELKTVLLNATPWMLDARDDNERMARLSLLFDKKNIEKTLSDNIELLDKLSCSNGGWSWCSRYPEPSQWSTRSVLRHFGRLAALGFMPDDSRLESMLRKALKWDTAETVREFREYPDGDYTAYVYLHDMFAGVGYGQADASVANAVTQRILSTWKDASLAVKAIDARVLYNHDFKAMARNIIASIRQFGETSSEKGTWYPSLDDAWYGTMDKVGITALILETFDMVEPGCEDVDNLRQWLILQKGSQDWGASSTASDVVAAILSTSRKWLVPAEGTDVKIGGKRVHPEGYERMTGEFEVSLSAKDVSGKTLSVKKVSDTPSWGAVYCRYTDDMVSVKPSGCPELSIEKAFTTDKFAVGDRVTVRLTLKVNADMDYVAIVDERPACLEPVEQLPSPIYAEGLCFYRENRDSSTRIFIDHLPKGTYVLTYDVWINNAGVYTSGIASVQSQYAPRYAAHSGGGIIEVER